MSLQQAARTVLATTFNGSIVAYLGAVGGGVWKTTNCCSEMTTWSVTTDDPLIGTTAIDTPSNPPATLPSTIRVIVTSSIRKSGGTVSGNIPQMAVINVDPGYQPDPDHPGTGTVVSVDCP